MMPTNNSTPIIKAIVLALSISAGAGIYYYFSQDTTQSENELEQIPECSCPIKTEEIAVKPEMVEPEDTQIAQNSLEEIAPEESDIQATKPCSPTLGFTSTAPQPKPCRPKITGTIPVWINGDFLAIGPGIFEIGGNKATHWLDGLAMIHNFSFHHGTLTYTSRLINSGYYKDAMKKGKISGSSPERKQSTWAKLSSAFSSSDRAAYDNTNVNIIPFRNSYIALTETPHHLMLEPKTLKTLYPFIYSDKIEAQFASAHPHFDPETKEWYGFMINYAHNSDYLIYKRAENSNKREIVATIPVGYPAYIHTFSITKNYFIITEAPLAVSPYDLLMTDKAYIETFSWKPKSGTQFIVIDRATGNIVGRYKTDAFFVLHHINAFEKNNEIIIDLVAYDDHAIITAFNLEKICTNNPKLPISYLRRYIINRANKTVSMKTIYPGSGEMPGINEKYRGKEYEYLYCTMNSTPGTLADQICKIDVTTGKKIIWQMPHAYPNEPVFVPAPHQRSEDDGVIISHVLDTNTQQTFIVILDAHNLQELARAYICGHIPFTVHSKFIPEMGHGKI
jgi:carotenoid cleavage dioxygenase-like enzyme